MRITGLYILLLLLVLKSTAQQAEKGALLYSASFSNADELRDWKMEGAGKTEFSDGRMIMYSPGEEGHHVFWCPQEFPASFIAEWEVQNLHTDGGLCIIFFAAKGLNGEDIFDASLPKRDGTFKNYTKGAINNYHISYYANAKGEKGRETANLRKNKGFHKVQTGEPGIPIHSTEVHKVKLVKQQGHIQLFIDGRSIINYMDDGKRYGAVLEGGKIGFRQMKWTRFAYRNFKVWEAEE